MKEARYVRSGPLNCNLTEGIEIYYDIETNECLYTAVYIGPCGVLACSEECADPQVAYQGLRQALQITRVDLYVIGKGLYDPLRDVYHDSPFCNTDEEAGLPLTFVLDRIGPYRFRQTYSLEEQKRIGEKVVRMDAMKRGWYRATDGRLYLRAGNIFREASGQDSDYVYYAALFGGMFGAHRFLLGKWWTGLLYLLTGGLFFTGWAVDVLFLLLGIMKDKRGRILCPLSKRMYKLLLIPIGLFVSAAAGAVQISFIFTALSYCSYAFTETAKANSDVIFEFFQSWT